MFFLCAWKWWNCSINETEKFLPRLESRASTRWKITDVFHMKISSLLSFFSFSINLCHIFFYDHDRKVCTIQFLHLFSGSFSRFKRDENGGRKFVGKTHHDDDPIREVCVLGWWKFMKKENPCCEKKNLLSRKDGEKKLFKKSWKRSFAACPIKSLFPLPVSIFLSRRRLEKKKIIISTLDSQIHFSSFDLCFKYFSLDAASLFFRLDLMRFPRLAVSRHFNYIIRQPVITHSSQTENNLIFPCVFIIIFCLFFSFNRHTNRHTTQFSFLFSWLACLCLFEADFYSNLQNSFFFFHSILCFNCPASTAWKTNHLLLQTVFYICNFSLSCLHQQEKLFFSFFHKPAK